MVRIGKEIESSKLCELVAVCGEKADVTGESHWVTRNVDQLARPQISQRINYCSPCACSRRVEHNRCCLQAGALCCAGIAPNALEIAIDAIGNSRGPHPFSEVLGCVIGCSGVGLDRGDAHGFAEAVSNSCGKQADPTVEVEVGGPRVEFGLVDGGLHRTIEGVRCVCVHLPEAIGSQTKGALVDDLVNRACGGSGRATLLVTLNHSDSSGVSARSDHVNIGRARKTLAERRDLRDAVCGQRQRGDGHDGVRTRSERANTALFVNLQTHTSAPGRSIEFCSLWCIGCRSDRFDRECICDFGAQLREALQGVGQNSSLEVALLCQSDVPELSPTSPFGRVSAQRGLGPDVFAAFGSGGEHLKCLCSPKTLVPVVGDSSKNFLAGQGVAHKNDAPLVTRHENAAVGDVGDIEFNLGANVRPSRFTFGPRSELLLWCRFLCGGFRRMWLRPCRL